MVNKFRNWLKNPKKNHKKLFPISMFHKLFEDISIHDYDSLNHGPFLEMNQICIIS